MNTQFTKYNEYQEEQASIFVVLQEHSNRIETEEAALATKTAELAQAQQSYAGAEGEDDVIDTLKAEIESLKKRIERLKAVRPDGTHSTITYDDLVSAWQTQFYPQFTENELDPAYERLAAAKANYLAAMAEVDTLLAEAETLRKAVAERFNQGYPHSLILRKRNDSELYFSRTELGL